MAPVPGEYPLIAQDLAESRMAEQLCALVLEMRIELMVREQHHLAVAGLCEDAPEPRHLLVVDRMIVIGDIESD